MILSYCSESSDLLSVSGFVPCLSLGRGDGGKQKTTDKVKWQLDQLTMYIHTLTQGRRPNNFTFHYLLCEDSLDCFGK